VPPEPLDSLAFGMRIAPVIAARVQRVRDDVPGLDRTHEPIPLRQTPTSAVMGHLHYGNPPVLEQLRWMPYLALAGTGLLLLLGMSGLAGIRQAEKRVIWVGMAKETAHQLGRKAAAHSHAADGTRAAVEAGVDTIDHGTFLDDATIKLMKAHGTWLVPTMLAPATALAQGRAGALNPASVPKAEEAAAAARESHRKAIAAGVRIAFGTDTGVSKQGDNGREFARLVEAGMTPAAAFRAATVSAAEALDRPGLGRIAPGLAADIIAVDGDPLGDVRQLEDVDFVMKGGQIIRAD